MKAKNYFKVVFLLGFVLFIQNCEKETPWDLDNKNNDSLVVEAILTNEFVKQEIQLSQSYDALNDAPVKVSDAKVTVEANGVVFDFVADPDIPGLYKSENPFEVLSGLEYNLSIDWQDEIYLAKSTLSSVAPLPDISFRQIRDTDTLSFVSFVSPYNPNQQAMYEMEVDWSALSGDSLDRARTYFYTFNTVDESEILPPPQEDFEFPRGSIVYAKKFGLNDDFAEYLRSLLLETVWKGNFLYSSSASLPTNISNDGLGFFTTCAVVTDTLIAE